MHDNPSRYVTDESIWLQGAGTTHRIVVNEPKSLLLKNGIHLGLGLYSLGIHFIFLFVDRFYLEQVPFSTGHPRSLQSTGVLLVAHS